MKKFFLPLLFTAIILGILSPFGQHLKPILPVLLSTLLFFNFYCMTFEKHHFFQRETLLYFLIVLVIGPYLIFPITTSFSEPFRLGILLTVITPSAISGTIVVGIIGGDRGLSVANILIYNLLSPFSYSFLMKLYFQTGDLQIPIGKIITKLFLLVFIPFVLSLLFKRIHQLTHPLHVVASYANFLFLLIVFTAISSSFQQLRTIPGRELFGVIVFIFFVAGGYYLLGFISGRNLVSKKALAVTIGQRNLSLCIWLALSNFGSLAAIPPTVYIIIQHIFNSLLILIFSRQSQELR